MSQFQMYRVYAVVNGKAILRTLAGPKAYARWVAKEIAKEVKHG